MVYMIDTDGTVVYRAKWNDPEELEDVLDKLRAGHPIEKRESHAFVAPARYVGYLISTL